MDPIAEKTLSFFISNSPSWNTILIGAPVGILWSWICLRFAGYLKLGKGCRTGYTRKVFHFLIFTSVVIIQF
jgi:phytol kinase